MSEETVNLRLDKETSTKLLKLTKSQLIEKMVIAALEAKVATGKAEILQTKLDKAEAYVEQGRSMITAVMDRWYEYDT